MLSGPARSGALITVLFENWFWEKSVATPPYSSSQAHWPGYITSRSSSPVRYNLARSKLKCSLVFKFVFGIKRHLLGKKFRINRRVNISAEKKYFGDFGFLNQANGIWVRRIWISLKFVVYARPTHMISAFGNPNVSTSWRYCHLSCKWGISLHACHAYSHGYTAVQNTHLFGYEKTIPWKVSVESELQMRGVLTQSRPIVLFLDCGFVEASRCTMVARDNNS